MIVFHVFLSTVAAVYAGPATEAYKDQHCTDPRTMRKHAAYTEWADAYSCTRHRCQPGGRNLAIYTVGCKRVEAPESAIECEEVVEDTNMQFPYCCTRLRCLVVVRGEVWTRVLGQPWETLPAAPWSHMYKMKKPPPVDGTFIPKPQGEGPIYELHTEPGHGDGGHEKVLRSSKSVATEAQDCNEGVARAVPSPDIVIALSTNTDTKEHKKSKTHRHKRGRKTSTRVSSFVEEEVQEPRNEEIEETPSTEKPLPTEPASDERYNVKAPAQGQQHSVSWTEIPQSQWTEHDPSMDADNGASVPRTQLNLEHQAEQASQYHRLEQVYQQPEPHQPEFTPSEPEKEKPGNLQTLVDAIGTRMRDIENVVQRMSEKVHQANPSNPPESDFGSEEKRAQSDGEANSKHRIEVKEHSKEAAKVMKPNPDSEHYKRFSVRSRGSKYLHTTESSTEQPLFVEDTSLNGYFSDASNSVLRRGHPKEPVMPTYMAPVENRRKAPHVSELSEEVEKKRKKHGHKKKHSKAGRHKKHRGKDEKRKRFNRVNSFEVDKNVVSLEDSSAGAAGA